jgi:hypothetical protein
MTNFDLSEFALKCVCPNNEILYDDKGMPSVMVYIPKFKISDVITGGADSVHPAFIVNGKEIDGIYISKYQNIVKDGRAYSLPGQDPKSYVTLEQSIAYCNAKGEGWHCMTRAEWAAIALWCKKNGTQPLGNNNYGKDSSESMYKGKPMTYDSDGKIMHIATGSGPVTYSHDGTVNGIWDLNGNVSEWQGGLRIVYGEVQVLANNNAADEDNSQVVNSAQWKAIDATTGELVTSSGDGSTTGTVKMDWQSSHCVYTTTITTKVSTSRSAQFASTTCDSTISDAAKAVLQALALMPEDGASAADYNNDYLYFNNGESERAFCAGGGYGYGSIAGVFYLDGTTRSNAISNTGFRSAFCKLPTE